MINLQDPGLHHYDRVEGVPLGTLGVSTTRDGLDLLTRHWPAIGPDGANVGRPWARVLLVHGLSEHSGRYERVAGWLARAGLDVHAYDQRGWGASEGQRGHATRWDDYLDDLGERVAALQVLSPSLPVAVYGHSLGALITTEYVLFDAAGRPRPDRVVLSGTGLLSNYPWWLVTAARIMGRLTPTYRPPRTNNGHTLSRDPEVSRRFSADPYLGSPSAGFGYLGLREQVRAQQALEALAAANRPFPVRALALHGEADGLVPFRAVDWFRPLSGVDVRPYAGLRHELHNEPEGESVVADVIAWLRTELEGAR